MSAHTFSFEDDGPIWWLHTGTEEYDKSFWVRKKYCPLPTTKISSLYEALGKALDEDDGVGAHGIVLVMEFVLDNRIHQVDHGEED